MTREDWLAKRRQGIGGSDAASIFNIGYGCRRRLVYDKRGVEPDYPKDESLIMKLGNLLEPFFAEEYARKTGRIVNKPGSTSHPLFPMFRVNVDAEIIAQDKSGPGVLEQKAQGQAAFSKTKREGVVEDYICQVNWGCMVRDLQWGAFQIGCRDSGESIAWDVDRDESLIDAMVEEGEKLWAIIQDTAAPLPDRLPIDDKRCSDCQWRQTCQGDALVHLSGEKDCAPGEDIRGLLALYDERKPLVDEADALLEEVKEQLKDALFHRPAVALPWPGRKKDRKVYFRPQDGRVTWETEDLVRRYEALRMAERTVRACCSDGEQAAAEFDAQFPAADTFKRQGVPFRVLRVY